MRSRHAANLERELAVILQHPRAQAVVRSTAEALALLARDEQAAGQSVRLAKEARDRDRALALRELCDDPDGLACLLRSFTG